MLSLGKKCENVTMKGKFPLGIIIDYRGLSDTKKYLEHFLVISFTEWAFVCSKNDIKDRKVKIRNYTTELQKLTQTEFN